MQQKNLKLFTIAAFILLFILPMATFWPGTTGGFLLDDHDNLQTLQKHGGVKDFNTLRQFVFSGISGPTGRPVSLASFLIDSQTWPTDSFSFKRTNILIHAFNGLLIFAVVLKLFQLIGSNKNSALTIAFLSAAIWVIHPLHTSTVLYIIQRMTELVAFFTLIGIWCYLHGRQKLISTPGPGYIWMSASILIFGTLATLSKENGILLPLYILIIEFTLLRNVPRPYHWRHWAIPMLAIPTLILIAYLGQSIGLHASKFAHRDFNLYERLLSEARVLFDYLGKIIIPTHTPSLYFDDFQKSTSLFAPVTTLASVIMLIISFTASIAYNKRAPILSFAVLWFLGGHLLESSVLPLELYFEHRNYLPMLGVIIAIAFYLEQLTQTKKKWLVTGSAFLIFGLTATSWQHSNNWSNNTKLFALLAEKQPDSARAQINQTTKLFKTGDGEQAMKQLEKIKERFPGSLGIAILNSNVMCQNNQLTIEGFKHLVERARTTTIDSYTNNSLSQLINNVHGQHCKQLTNNSLLALIDALLENKVSAPNKNRLSKLHQLKANIFINQKKLNPALIAMDTAFRYRPNVDIALNQARLLISANQIEAASTQLNKAVAVDKLRSRLLPSRLEEIEEVRSSIRTSAIIN